MARVADSNHEEKMRLFHPDGPTLWELARQALSSVEEGYDLLAPRFDHTPFRTPDSIITATLDIVEPLRDLRALDLCTGTGAAARALAVRGARVGGVDASAGMLRVAQERSPNIDWHKVDALRLPADWEASFELVTSFGAFGHFERSDIRRLLREARRVLVDGGRFVFVTSSPPPRLSLSHALAAAFDGAMRVRNALWKPPFVMYYLQFFVDEARRELEASGFTVRTIALNELHPRLFAVVATAC
ncbi:MAG: ubiquinone/menaquinone biosynthesis C-methylase UbiE [Polyangiales bacterium]